MRNPTGPRLAAAVLLLSLLLTACGPAGPEATPAKNQAGYTDISVQQLDAMLQHKDFVLVNTHIPYEGELAGTDLFLPYDQIADLTDQLPADKSARIVLYCRSGRMSTIAAETLVALGYTNVFELDGGMVDWENSGLPLEYK